MEKQLQEIEVLSGQLGRRCRSSLPVPAHLRGMPEPIRRESVQEQPAAPPAVASGVDVCTTIPKLGQWKQRLDDAVAKGNRTLEELSSMEQKLKALDEVTNSVRAESDQISSGSSALMVKKSRLERVFTSTKSTLTKFQKVDELSNEVVNPLLNASSTRFPIMVDEMDEAAEFLRNHTQYRSTKLFAGKVSLALHRAAMCLRDAIAGDLDLASANVLSSLSYSQQFHDKMKVPFTGVAHTRGATDENPQVDQCSSLGSALAMLNAEFIAKAESSAPLRRLLEARMRQQHETYIGDVMSSYRDARAKVTAPLVEDFAARHAEDLPQLTVELVQLYNEYAVEEEATFNQIWIHESLQSHFPAVIEEARNVLYSSFRRRLLQEDSVEVLSKVCAGLKILRGTSPTTEGPLTVPTKESRDSADSSTGGNGPVLFVQRMYQDSQERMIFRTSIYTRTMLSNTKPTPQEIEKCCQEEVQDLEVMKRCSFIMNLLASALERNVFNVFGEECLDLALAAINAAVKLRTVVKTADGQGVLHVYLLCLRSLLELRGLISKYETNATVVEKSIDLSSIAAKKLSIVQSQRDLKREIEKSLKECCEGAIEVASKAAGAPLRSGAPENAAEVITEANNVYQLMRTTMGRYVDASATLVVLLKPVRMNIETDLAAFTEKLQAAGLEAPEATIDFSL